MYALFVGLTCIQNVSKGNFSTVRVHSISSSVFLFEAFFPKFHSVVRKVSVSLLENGPKNRRPFNSDDDLSYQWRGYYCVTIVPLMNKGG